MRASLIRRAATTHGKAYRRVDVGAQRKIQSDGKLIISIQNGAFYSEHPSSQNVSASTSNPPLFPGLKFKFPASPKDEVGKPVKLKPHWAVIAANTTPFLKVLQGDYIAVPPTARTYPYLSTDEIAEKDPRLRIPSQAIQYVGFSNTSNAGSSGVRGAYLSARYESRREETDWSLSQYLRGQTELNPSEELSNKLTDEALFSRVVRDLRLNNLLHMPVSNLSNGQTRRSRIAKALLSRPEVLLLDEPFMGLDPPTLVSLSPILKDLAYRSSPNLVLGLRPQDPIPDWITNLVILGNNNTVVLNMPIERALYAVYNWFKAEQRPQDAVSDIDKKMARALRAAHGPPPFEFAHLLTSYGIHKFTAVEVPWAKMQRMPRKNGVLDFGDSDQPDVREMKRASQIPEAKRTSRNWIDLASPVTHGSHTVLLGARKALEQGAPIKAASKQDQNVQVKQDAEISHAPTAQEPLIELNSVIVRYGDKVVLGHPPPQLGHTEQGLNLVIARGTRMLLLGPNGSGKTTLLSLLTSDHPQSYSLPIKFFGRMRLPAPGKPGLSLWEIQSRIGHSAPEVHAFFPRNLTVRQVLESAWSETYSSKPELNEQRTALVDHFLQVWKPELYQTLLQTNNNDTSIEWASDKVNHPMFGRLPFNTQRLLLLLRAIIKQPDIIILDEAFSGLSSSVRDKALTYLEKGDYSLDASLKPNDVVFPGLTDQQALVVVSHVREEVPPCINEFVRLPSEEEAVEHGKPVQIGRSDGGEIISESGWNRIWGL